MPPKHGHGGRGGRGGPHGHHGGRGGGRGHHHHRGHRGHHLGSPPHGRGGRGHHHHHHHRGRPGGPGPAVVGAILGGAAVAAAVGMATSQARHANARAMAAEAARKPQTVGGTTSAPPQQATALGVYPSGHPYAVPCSALACVPIPELHCSRYPARSIVSPRSLLMG
eukprot:COSAG02_NODE_147_length_33939_cov_6.689539_16_plen_167_part_00